jgi:hypothetical protein
LLFQKNRAEEKNRDYKYIPTTASSPKANEPKKKRPEMTTSAKTGACYTCLVGATVLSEVRTISGLPAHLYLENSLLAS